MLKSTVHKYVKHDKGLYWHFGSSAEERSCLVNTWSVRGGGAREGGAL